MNKNLIFGLSWVAAIFAVAIGASFARKLGYLDGDMVTRLVVGLNGLMIASIGNRMPKLVVPSTCARRVQRIGGWAMVLSGLLYTALWALAPIPVALIAGTGAIALGMALTIGYSLALRDTARAETRAR
ncbi:ammonium transporter [Sphingomonas sp. MMS12-HWE2-04]|uniref:ammonium transporter n=1 Tax=Sphingomonas sp. MMS12-HWE2-04 TaxID=3234199 RepID=UPI003851580C